MSAPPQAPPRPTSIARIAVTALVTGIVGFGGGFAVVGRLKTELVDEKRWVEPAEFLEAAAIASALPGTTATNLFTMLGYRRAGLAGAAACTVAFIAPSVTLMIVFGAFYDRFRGITAARTFMDGMNAAIVGVVAAVAVDMRHQALRRPIHWVIAGTALALLTLHVVPLAVVVLLAGLVGVVDASRTRTRRIASGDAPAAGPAAAAKAAAAATTDDDDDRDRGVPPTRAPLVWLAPLGAAAPTATAGGLATIATLFGVFATIGVATFGGGVAMIPAIAHESLARGWLDDASFADAIAFGQVTPGPVAISATFIGYRVAGLAGALAATAGIFLPPFGVVLVVVRSLAAFHRSPLVRGFLAGIAPAVVGIIASAAVSLGRASVHHALAAGIAAGALVVRIARPRTSPLVPLVAGALLALAVERLLAR